MPIYEYYCPDNHTVYQFYAKTLAQGRLTPVCPDNPAYRLEKQVSAFAVASGGHKTELAAKAPRAGDAGGDDPRMAAALGAMEREFASVDENDPKTMARMMRRMADLSGEKINGEMEEVVRKLEEGADPESLEEQMGGEDPENMADPGGEKPADRAVQAKAAGPRCRARRQPLRRDPKLYDYQS